MLIRMTNIQRAFHKGAFDVMALRQVTLSIAEGEFVAIMGPSGSGKSTLLHLLGCLDTPTRGEYTLDGINVSELDDTELSLIRNRKIGFVFQSFNLLPQYTVLQNIEAPLLYAHESLSPSPPTNDAHQLAQQVGLSERLRHRPSELSGGEMQRVAIARALITRPRVILADEPTGNLDSHTGQDIMKMLKTLHEQGNTIIVVTHEQAVSEYAQRTILLKDGEVEQEIGARAPGPPWSADFPARPGAQASGPPWSADILSTLPSLLRTAVRGVLLHKLRSFLSVLGIVFGIGAIIAMLAIGAGARQEIVEQIALLGTNNITVKAVERTEETDAIHQARRSQGVTSGDVERIARISPFITHLAPLRTFSARIQSQRATEQTRIVATTSPYQYTGNLPLSQGRFLTPADEEHEQRVCVLGADVRQDLFAFRNPVGEMVKIRNNWFRVIGVLENKELYQKELSAIQMRDANKQVYIPLSSSSVFISSQERERIQEISIRVDEPDHVDEVARLIRIVLARVHHETEDYEVVVPRELLKQSQQAQHVFNVVLGSIAGISLLVGGIGIMNIMLATVTERTREIGVRRAIGANRKMILLQFLIETLVLTLVGGGLGILLGVGGAWIISFFAGWRTLISLRTIILAFSISAAVGLVFGMYPASQGASMNPIAALKYE